MIIYNLFEYGCTWSGELFLGSFLTNDAAETAILQIVEKHDKTCAAHTGRRHRCPKKEINDYGIKPVVMGEISDVAFFDIPK